MATSTTGSMSLSQCPIMSQSGAGHSCSSLPPIKKATNSESEYLNLCHHQSHQNKHQKSSRKATKYARSHSCSSTNTAIE
ncbi:CLUMA_CG001128, isoform A [Clunio marinus]|uniref:CLUMA_CG001128, isoform A n=1 Tax=Clunio marinus TaxID=568069 RepID=A0A1J1HLJ5_9DIPT|nr:CLUMA_CG001128, isoform A [Clunio marinus]